MLSRIGGRFMESPVPVAGIDVSKRFSDMCVLSPQNDVLLRQKIYHDMTAEEKLREIETQYRAQLVVVMESTSHYHLILFQVIGHNGTNPNSVPRNNN